MALGLNSLMPRQALVEAARDFHARGWMWGTAGNLSARVRGDQDAFWITAGDNPKGHLEQQDLMLVTVADGQVLERGHFSDRPAAEIAIHLALYRLFREVRAVFHVHSVDACLATEGIPEEAAGLALPPLEMLKGLAPGEEGSRAELPLFTNHPSVPRIADEVVARFSGEPPPVPALMIRDHGLTVWGNSCQEAYNRLEALEFLMSYLARRR